MVMVAVLYCNTYDCWMFVVHTFHIKTHTWKTQYIPEWMYWALLLPYPWLTNTQLLSCAVGVRKWLNWSQMRDNLRQSHHGGWKGPSRKPEWYSLACVETGEDFLCSSLLHLLLLCQTQLGAYRCNHWGLLNGYLPASHGHSVVSFFIWDNVWEKPELISCFLFACAAQRGNEHLNCPLMYPHKFSLLLFMLPLTP